MKTFTAVIAVGFVAVVSAAAQVPGSSEAEQAVRLVVRQLVDARAAGDLEAALALWDSAAESGPVRSRLRVLFKTSEQVLGKLDIRRVTVQDDRAEARVDSSWTLIDRHAGSSRDVEDRTVFTLVRGPNGWRFTKEVSAAALLADALMGTQDDTARARLLEEDRSLIGIELFTMLTRHGQQAQGVHDPARALTAYTLAEEIARRIDSKESLGDALQGIGNVHYFAGRYERALDAFERRLAIEEALGRKDDVASAVVSIATAKYALGRYLEARDSYDRYRALVEASRRPDLLVGAYVQVANCDLLLGDYDTARQTYGRAIELAERSVLKKELPRAWYGRGRAHAGMGDYRRALEAFTRALALNEEANDMSAAAATLVGMGQVAFEQGQHLRALEHYTRSRGIFEAIKAEAGIGQTWVAAGLIRAARGEHEEAVRAYEQAIAPFERAKDADGLALAHLGMGYALTNLDKFDLADASYERARTLYETGNRIGLTRTLLGLGLLRLRQERAPAALDMARQAFEMSRAVRHRGLQAHAETLAGRAQLRLGNNKAAEDAFTRATTVFDEMAFDTDADAGISAEDLDEPYHGLVETYVQRGDAVTAFAAAERGRLRHLQHVLRHLGLAPKMTEEERSRERRLKADVHVSGTQLLRETERPKPDPKRVAALERRVANARASLTSFRAALYRTNPLVARARGIVKPVDARAAAQAIPADVVVAAYTVTHTRTYIFALSSASAPPTCGPPGIPYVMPEGTNRLGVAMLVSPAVQRAQAREPEADAYLRGLAAMFLDPIRCHLERASTVIVVPDGALWQVPFEALKTQDGCDAIERWTFRYAPSLTVAFSPDAAPLDPVPEAPAADRIDGRVVISDAAPLYSYADRPDGTRTEIQQLAEQGWSRFVTAPHGEVQALATAAGDGLTAWVWALSLGGVRGALVPRWVVDDRVIALLNDDNSEGRRTSVQAAHEAVMRVRNDAVHGLWANWASFMVIGSAR